MANTVTTKRLFVAIKITPDAGFINRFREMKSKLRPGGIKWVEEHNIHVTLKFFGETPDSSIPAINNSLAEVTAGIHPFELRLQGLGIFGSSYQPRVIWTGIEPYKELADLMDRIHQALEKTGFPKDRQNLVPHLTLGRIRHLDDKERFRQVLDQYRDLASKTIKVDKIILFESILKKEGPEYHALRAHSLQ